MCWQPREGVAYFPERPLEPCDSPELGNLVRRELSPLPGLEPDQAQPRIASPVQVLDREPDGSAHPLHLVLATLVKRHLDPAHPCATPNDPSLRRGRSPVLELDSGSKRVEHIG